MAIFDCNLAIKKIKKIKYLACNFRLRSLRELFFDCDLRANFSSIAIFAQTFLRLRSSREVFDLRANFSVIEIFVRSCDLFGAQFSVAIFSLDTACSDAVSFRLSFGRFVHVDVMRLHVDGTTLMQGSDAVAFLWTRLFWMPYLSDAVSFGRS